MNSDQKLVAMLGLLLLIVVIFTTYRSYLQAIFFQSPTVRNATPSRGGTKTAPGGNAPWWEWMLAHGVP